MGSGVYIEVDQADLRLVMKKLKDMEKAPRHLRNAINRTATQAVKMIKAGRSQGYTINAGRFNRDIKVQRATASHLDATIKSQGRPPTLQSFETSMPKTGGEADITKSGLKKLVTSGGGAAFVPKGGSAAGLMAQRKGPERFPIRVLYGNSVPKMVEKIWEGERGDQRNMEESVAKHLHEEMMKEIEKIM